MSRRATSGGLIAAMLLGSGNLAFIAPVAAAGAGNDDSGGRLEEIIVTAQKRSQNSQDVPVAVSAVDASVLANANVTSAAELGKIVPSLRVFTPANTVTPFIRGIGNPNALNGSEGSAAVYIDGVYLARPSVAFLQLNSIERVEVLKGPQGTLFGRNASAGLIHIITREPTGEPMLEGSIGYGDYDTTRAGVYASTGITDSFAFDVAGLIIKQNDGFGKNVATGLEYGKEDTKAIRTKLRWEADTDTTVTIVGDYSESENDFDTIVQNRNGPPRG